MDDTFLMSVLHCLADVDEQSKAFADGQLVIITVLGDRHAANQLHHEVRPARGGLAAVEHVGDIRMVHHGQRLPFRLEAGNDLPRVHAGLEDLERDAASDGLRLLGHEDNAEPALANLFQQLVGSD